MKELNWEKACKIHHLLQDNAPLIIDITPCMKAMLLDMKGSAKQQLQSVLHRYLDERIARWVSKASTKCPARSATINGDLCLRQRKEGCITAERNGHNYLLNAKSLRLKTALPETLAQSLVGKTVNEVAQGIEQSDDGKRVIAKYHRTAEGTTVLHLEPAELTFITYREMFGEPANRFICDTGLPRVA